MIYIENYLYNHEIDLLENKIAPGDINIIPISNSPNSRRIVHFGYFYSYDRTGLKPADEIPKYMKAIGHHNRINNLIEFDQVIINEYRTG